MRLRNILAFSWLSCLLFAALADRGIDIQLSRTAVQVGQSTWLTCRVTPDKANRRLIFGIVGSERDDSNWPLDGYNARITHGPYEIKHLDCGMGPAYCRVVQYDGRVLDAVQQIAIVPCNGGTK